MFLIGETIHIDSVGIDVEVKAVTPNMLSGVQAGTDRPFNLALTGHSYTALLHTVPIGTPEVAHAVGLDDRTRHMLLPNGTMVMARRYTKQWQWYINAEQLSAKKVWALLYS